MASQIQKWGNSYALRIPKAYADALGWGEQTEVITRVVEGRLVVEAAVSKPKYTLEELVSQITPENKHEEIDTGPSVGNEEW